MTSMIFQKLFSNVNILIDAVQKSKVNTIHRKIKSIIFLLFLSQFSVDSVDVHFIFVLCKFFSVQHK